MNERLLHPAATLVLSAAFIILIVLITPILIVSTASFFNSIIADMSPFSDFDTSTYPVVESGNSERYKR